MSDTMPANRSARVRKVNRGPARRVLIVANQTATSAALISDLQLRAKRGPVDFHLVVPALNSYLRSTPTMPCSPHVAAPNMPRRY